MLLNRQQKVLGGLVGISAIVTGYLLWAVLPTVFFGITIAYVLFPMRRWLYSHGVTARLSALICTVSAFLVGLLLLFPMVGALYFRRDQLFTSLQQLPGEVPLSIGGFSYTLELAAYFERAQALAGDVAVLLIQIAPIILLKVFVFTIVVYTLLRWPHRVRRAVLGPVPPEYQDIVIALHERTRSILYAIYVLQAAVGFGTFLIGFVVFFALGYESAFTLAVIGGVLQFIPILGPSVLVVVLAGIEVITGDPTGAVTLLVVGFVVIGFLPDALIRPRLARLTTGMPGSLYFVGFTGGVLSVGIVGLVAGPVVVALLAEIVSLLTEETTTV